MGVALSGPRRKSITQIQALSISVHSPCARTSTKPILNLGQALCDLHPTIRRAPSPPSAKRSPLPPRRPRTAFPPLRRPPADRKLLRRLGRIRMAPPPTRSRSTRFRFTKPRWTGQDLADKRILLHSEQGAGDLIQFSRLAAKLTQQGAHVILGLPARKSSSAFSRTLQRRFTQLVVTEPPASPIRNYDYHCYLLSLPLLLGLKLETIPANRSPTSTPTPRFVVATMASPSFAPLAAEP